MDHHRRRTHRRPVPATATATTYPPNSKQPTDPLLTISKPAGYIVQLATSQLELLSSSPFLRRLSVGLLGAVHAVAVLVAALVVAVVIGVVLVRMWVEEPVVVRRVLHFDYTDAEPSAVVWFGVGVKGRVVPAGHTARVCLELLMPESDYNRHIGVFQVFIWLGFINFRLID